MGKSGRWSWTSRRFLWPLLRFSGAAAVATVLLFLSLPTAGRALLRAAPPAAAAVGTVADLATEEAPTAVQASGSISGSVRFAGSPPDAAILQMAADPFCLTAHPGETVTAENLVVNDNGTLRWVFVYVREPGAAGRGASGLQPVELNQVACVYQPRVLGMQAGGTIKVTNSDTTLHNVNVQAANNPSFNVAQPIPGMSIERTFASPEVMIPVKCDVHSWMQAYVGVLPHSFFAVTGADGAFDISGLPAGDYVVEAWHETLGVRTLSVTVAAGTSSSADFSFGNDR